MKTPSAMKAPSEIQQGIALQLKKSPD